MHTRQLVAGAALALLLAIESCSATARVTKKELFHILHRDGMSTSLEPKTEIHSLGKVLIANHWYSLFFYAHVTPATKHGLYRILILNDKKIYVGGIMVDDGINCQIDKFKVICDDWHHVPYTLLNFEEKYLVELVTTGRADENFWK
jgi:hypothetical protein